MKKISLLLTVIFAIVGCNCQKKTIEESKKESASNVKQYNLPKIEYIANTRGFYERITIENQTVSVTNDRDDKKKGEETKITDDVNKELSSLVNSVNLEKLATYNDPTQKRFYDGAAIANLKIIVEGVEYKTKDFDHGNPPVEIEKLVNMITSFGIKR